MTLNYRKFLPYDVKSTILEWPDSLGFEQSRSPLSSHRVGDSQLSRCDVAVVALNQTRLAEEGYLNEVGAGHTSSVKVYHLINIVSMQWALTSATRCCKH